MPLGQGKNKMKTTHTHKGHCQVCGNMHAVDNSHNGLAKHGYTVDWGFFNGTCHGSDELPIQLDRTLADKTIASLDAEIDRLQSSLDTINDWFPESVYGYKLNGEFVNLPRIYSAFHTYDALYAMKRSKWDWDASKYNRLVEEGYETVELTFDEYKLASINVQFENPAHSLQEWRKTRERLLKSSKAQAEGHKYFLQELIEKFHGKPLIESNLVSKVVKELSEIASADIVNEVASVKTEERWGRVIERTFYNVWEGEAEKEINGKILKVVCKRNRTYKKYAAYTYVDGKKVGKKALEELLG